MKKILAAFILCCSFAVTLAQDTVDVMYIDSLIREFHERRPALRYEFTEQLPYGQGSRRATWSYDSLCTTMGILEYFIVSYNPVKGIGHAEYYFLKDGNLLQISVGEDLHRKPDGTLVIPEVDLWWLCHYYKNGQHIYSSHSHYGKPNAQWKQANYALKTGEKRLARLRRHYKILTGGGRTKEL